MSNLSIQSGPLFTISIAYSTWLFLSSQCQFGLALGFGRYESLGSAFISAGRLPTFSPLYLLECYDSIKMVRSVLSVSSDTMKN